MGRNTFLGLSSTEWTAIYTLLTAGILAVAVVTAVYAKRQWGGARDQLSEARRAQLEASRPYVIVTVEPSEASRHLFDLVVRNIGKRPALTVSIKLDPPPRAANEVAGHELSKAKMLNEPTAMIAPGQEMRAFYDSRIDRNGMSDLPASHELSLKYQDSSGNDYVETSVLDIDPMKGTTFAEVKTVHDIGKSLAEIQQTLKNASVMNRQGTLDVEASVEPHADRQARLAEQRADLEERHARLARRVLPNSTSADPGPNADPDRPMGCGQRS